MLQGLRRGLWKGKNVGRRGCDWVELLEGRVVGKAGKDIWRRGCGRGFYSSSMAGTKCLRMQKFTEFAKRHQQNLSTQFCIQMFDLITAICC